ncbi:MAG: hypothetical protein PHQ13_12115 [Rhodoferax sp.]|nr:hypothetical protein [Rhodoferax sp.]
MANSVVRTLPEIISEELTLRRLVMASMEITTSTMSDTINTTPFSFDGWGMCSLAA